MTRHNNIDLTVKTLIIIALMFAAFYFGRTLFVPMGYGLFIAIVLYPVCKWLENHHFPRSLAIATGLSIVILLFGILVWLFILEITALKNDLPELLSKMQPAMIQCKLWIENNFGISISLQTEGEHQTIWNMLGNPAGLISGILVTTSSSLFTLFLVPVFASLFLYSREQFVLFLEKLIGKKYDQLLQPVLSETIHTYFRFIKGMILVYIIVGILNSAGLLALGVKHALLFGFLTAIMTIIPYIGIIISALLPISVAWITKDSIWYPLGVVAVFAFVQYLEANIIFPRVVGTQLKVSTWATLVAILTGGILWGVSGMILFIPFMGILKIITEKFPGLNTLNILLSRDKKEKEVAAN